MVLLYSGDLRGVLFTFRPVKHHIQIHIIHLQTTDMTDYRLKLYISALSTLELLWICPACDPWLCCACFSQSLLSPPPQGNPRFSASESGQNHISTLRTSCLRNFIWANLQSIHFANCWLISVENNKRTTCPGHNWALMPALATVGRYHDLTCCVKPTGSSSSSTGWCWAVARKTKKKHGSILNNIFKIIFNNGHLTNEMNWTPNLVEPWEVWIKNGCVSRQGFTFQCSRCPRMSSHSFECICGAAAATAADVGAAAGVDAVAGAGAGARCADAGGAGGIGMYWNWWYCFKLQVDCCEALLICGFQASLGSWNHQKCLKSL